MDVEVINVEEGTDQDDGDTERSEGELNSADNPRTFNGDGTSEPYVGMEFISEDAAKAFYDLYARYLGFRSKAARLKMRGGIMYREFVCGRVGSRRRYSDNCEAMLRIEMKGQNKWVVTKFVSEHSHPMASTSKGHHLRPRRHFSSSGRTMPETHQGVGIFPSGIMYAIEGNGVTPETGHGITSQAEFNYDYYHGVRSSLPAEPNHEDDHVIRNTLTAEVKHDNSHGIKNPLLAELNWESNHGVRNAPSTESHNIVRTSSAGYISTNGNHVPVESNSGIKSTLSEPNCMRGSVVSNFPVKPSFHKRTLGRDAHNVLEYFQKMQAENPGFFYAVQLDEENCMINVFWADARSRMAYSHFGDAVTLDTKYRPHVYRVPFASFTGVNHHGQPILFGCALLLDDSEATFIWLLKTFCTAMNDRHPTSLITDQDRAIQAAVSQVFPQVRHCLSKWHVFREGQEKFGYLCNSNPNLQLDLYNCINLTATVEEFESAWDSVLDNYDLKGNDWLHSLYSIRSQWVPAYFRDSFFAVLSPNQGFDGPFFYGFVNHHTTLPMFFRQYETALEKCFETEIEADFDTIRTTPMLKTPSPMEKQAAELYTRKIFAKFQEELVETFVYTANRIEGDAAVSTFRVAKFEDDQKAYIVTFNYPELKASCSCKMFEYLGILCRHVLTVFTVTNVLQLPKHYILKRWTINAKTVIFDEHGNESHGQESITSLYNNLCRDAIRYAEEGAIDVETYNVAVSALREGWKKVAIVKKNSASVARPTGVVGGTGSDDKKTSAPNSDMFPLLWPRLDEMPKRFNRNDAGATSLLPVPMHHADLNMRRMAPISLNRDDGPPEKMVLLPCLKSMTWVMESKDANQGKVAVINLKLQDYSRTGAAESEVKFNLTRHTLEPMLKSMARISEQLSAPANKVAVINLKLQDTDTTSGESEVKFQVSRDTLSAMLRSMAYIREQISLSVDGRSEPAGKRHRK